MRIALYAPFKPLDHPNPSGDLIIARGLRDFLEGRGHTVHPVSPFRARWIYWRPWRLPALLREWRRADRRLAGEPADLWLTYHTYYKAPDLLGPGLSRRHGIPYIIFQGIYSTKRRKRFESWPGFHLNRRALLAARCVFTNRRDDRVNLRRLLPEDRIGYVAPGIRPGDFPFDPGARQALRDEWQVGGAMVILSAAMFRPGVKADGLAWTIRACGRLAAEGHDLLLVIAGDGRERTRLEGLAETHLPGRVRFVGKIPREALHRFYSAGDLFVFPGIRESLGMVYLEAQSCGLPVVAFANGGVPEVVGDGETGFLTPPFDDAGFDAAVATLIADDALRHRMGEAARRRVRERHDLDKNYGDMEMALRRIHGG
jgi:glycosyltransferase involved in cell wall biosynthesis